MEPLWVRPTYTLRRADSVSSRQAIKKAISRPPKTGVPEARATIRPMLQTSRPRAGLRSIPATVTVLIALLAAACGSSTPTATPSTSVVGPSRPAATASPVAASSGTPSTPTASPVVPPDPATEAVYDTVEQQVIAIRGLQPKRPVERQFIDEAELRTLITQQFDEQTPPAYVAANERLYKALGLIPADASLRDLSLDLLSGGVVGFYRNDEGKLYVVSKTGTPGANERFYFAHEYTHALQDQNTTVFKDQQGILDQGDRLLARQAIYEGDATLLMTIWASQHLSQTDLLELLSASSDPAVQALYDRMPAILRDTLTYPYTTGLSYVQTAQSAGGWAAVNAFYDRMPASTEQILHPKKYDSAEAPVTVTLPADLATRLGSGWTVPMQDTFGELQMGIWLRDRGVDPVTALAAAAGWGGDRLAVMNGPAGVWAIAMQTIWDTTADAKEFETAATTALKKAGGVARVLPGTGGKTRWIVVASDAPTLGLAAGALGLAG
jgi:hypothetical protein